MHAQVGLQGRCKRFKEKASPKSYGLELQWDPCIFWILKIQDLYVLMMHACMISFLCFNLILLDINLIRDIEDQILSFGARESLISLWG